MASGNQRRREAALHGESRKRKDVDDLDASRVPPTTKLEPAPPPAPSKKPAAGGDNRLLAGYLAHEFLTKGTLFGERWPPPAPGAKPPPPPPPHPVKQPAPPETKAGNSPAAYAEVAYLLKKEGAHIPGVVNPTQLARLLRSSMSSDRY